MATSLRPSISDVFIGQLDPENLPLESNSESLAAICNRSYIDSKFTCPTPTHQGDSRSYRWEATPSMFGTDVLTYAQIDAIVLDFLFFPALGNGGENQEI